MRGLLFLKKSFSRATCNSDKHPISKYIKQAVGFKENRYKLYLFFFLIPFSISKLSSLPPFFLLSTDLSIHNMLSLLLSLMLSHGVDEESGGPEWKNMQFGNLGLDKILGGSIREEAGG